MSARLAAARRLAPGVLVAGTIAMAATFLSYHDGAPVMPFARLLGMAFNFLAEDARCAAAPPRLNARPERENGAQ